MDDLVTTNAKVHFYDEDIMEPDGSIMIGRIDAGGVLTEDDRKIINQKARALFTGFGDHSKTIAAPLKIAAPNDLL